MINANLNTISRNYSGGGAKEYEPTDFDGLQYWFDISKLDGYSENDPIESIPSAFDGGFDLRKINDARRALYKPGVLNGHAVMEQVNNGGYLNPSGNIEVTNFMHKSSSTLFWLIKCTTLTGSSQTLFDSRGTTSANVGRKILTNTSGDLQDVNSIGGGNNCFDSTAISSILLDNEWVVITMRFDSSLTTDAYKLESNNILKIAKNKINDPSSSDSEYEGRWFINADLTSNTHFKGQVATWGGYNRYLSDDELSKLIGGLITKYGQ